MIANREHILETIRHHLVELFEIPRETIKPEARLYEDLDLDSIDAVDLVVRLQEITGKRIQPDAFKSVRTVEDIVECIQAILRE